jgi:hypothetical protein
VSDEKHTPSEEFRSDCDRECRISVYKKHVTMPVDHSRFCPHAPKPPPTEVERLAADNAALRAELERERYLRDEHDVEMERHANNICAERGEHREGGAK